MIIPLAKNDLVSSMAYNEYTSFFKSGLESLNDVIETSDSGLNKLIEFFNLASSDAASLIEQCCVL